jgi:hypothetical protein
MSRYGHGESMREHCEQLGSLSSHLIRRLLQVLHPKCDFLCAFREWNLRGLVEDICVVESRLNEG